MKTYTVEFTGNGRHADSNAPSLTTRDRESAIRQAQDDARAYRTHPDFRHGAFQVSELDDEGNGGVIFAAPCNPETEA